MKKIYFVMLIFCISMGIFTQNSYGKEIVHNTGTRIEAVSVYADSEPEENFTFEERREGRYITGYIGTNKNILIDKSVMKDVTGIAEGAFEYTDIETFTIVNDFDFYFTVEKEAFKGCKYLTEVRIRNLNIVGDRAFYDCGNLEKVWNLGGQYSIGEEAFAFCTKLKDSVDGYHDPHYIGNRAFYCCDNITTVHIAYECVRIGKGAFQDSGVQKVYIDLYNLYNGYKMSIEEKAFADCRNLEKVEWYWDNHFYKKEDKNVWIGDYAFYNCPKLTDFEVPDTVQGIGDYALGYVYDKTKLSNFKLSTTDKTPGCVYAINNGFKEHDQHTYTLIAYEAPTCEEDGTREYECSLCKEHETEIVPKLEHDYIERLIVKNATTSKEGEIAYVCSKCGARLEGSLPMLDRDGTKFKDGNYTYQILSIKKRLVRVTACQGENKKMVLPDTVKYKSNVYKVTQFSKDVFKNAKKTKEIVIGKNITVIPEKAFQKCKSLKKLEIKSKKITKIGKYAFEDLKKKAVITLPKKCRKEYTKLLKRQKTKAKILWK